jgi:nucleotide-binding universal stress UspA family protein
MFSALDEQGSRRPRRLVRPRHTVTMNRHVFTVVVGVDGSASARAALQWAIGEARAREGRVRVITAWTSPYAYQAEILIPPDEDKLRARSQRVLDETLEAVDVNGVTVDTEVVEGDPRSVLVRAADQADLLVVGSRGHGPLGELLLGSVSSYCAHHATVPVVLVRGKASVSSGR